MRPWSMLLAIQSDSTIIYIYRTAFELNIGKTIGFEEKIANRKCMQNHKRKKATFNTLFDFLSIKSS